jgi:hypothetical protein
MFVAAGVNCCYTDSSSSHQQGKVLVDTVWVCLLSAVSLEINNLLRKVAACYVGQPSSGQNAI